MRYVLINLAVAGPQRVIRLLETDVAAQGEGYIDVTDRPEICALSWYDVATGDFVEAPEPGPSEPVVPASVTMRQARLALLSAGLLDDVEAALDSMGDTPEGKAARIEWGYSSEVWRHKPFVQQLSAALGLSDSQVDEMFIVAAGIE
ncbi:hypothetical protein LOY46_11380 [Pseudomonas sichuanensis]|uniref:hypothetical protein n=1 Tax=Pseudomonas sichuanensis TaxID=2213015 RepID=UPI00215FAEF3|nr:hypothetical protein [Pseudomonas sichuanensis]UVK85245.1 hypothetical protein LOY46_11380 [Pseudomonas sichuanensis]